MRKLLSLMMAMVLCLSVKAQAWHDFAIDLYTSTIVAEDEREQWQLIPDFGLAVAEDGAVSRVAADDASALAIFKGYKWHGDHGVVPGTLEVKVPGTVKVTYGCCTYGSDVTVSSPSGSFVIESTKQCYKNDPSNVASGIYVGDAATLTLTGGSYVRYYAFAVCEAPKEPAVFRDFAVQVNNQEGTMLTAEEQAQGTQFKFGIAVNEEGVASRVDADDASALAVVSGKFHSDHGSNNLKVVVPVEGKTKITFGNCTYSSAPYKVTPKGGETIEIALSEQNCWKNGHTSVTEFVYTGDATTLTIEGSNYTPYIKVEKVAAASYDNVAGVIAWANGNESRAEVTDIEAAVLETSVSVGSDLTVSGPTSYTKNIPEAETALMTYLPTTSNPGCVPGDMIEYKIKLKKGLVLTVSSVEFDAVKEGTDNAYFSWSYTVDGVESDIVAYDSPKTQIRRNNNANPDAPLTHVEKIAADGGREFSLRFYISNVANNKKMSIGNIKVNGVVNGAEEVRAFQNFAIDFRTNPYTVTKPADGVLPEGVVVSGTWHDGQHGYNSTTVTVPVDGPVKIIVGNCQYNGHGLTVTKGDLTSSEAAPEVLVENLDCSKDCNSTTTWVYNSEEPAILNITTPSYTPSLAVEACELLPMVKVTYYDTDGALLGEETVQGGSALAYKFSAADVKVPAGHAFRGWFASEQQTALKVAEGSMIQDNIKLYARATEIEVPTSTSRYIYDLTKPYFYVEDHEAIEIDGKYYNTHGWLVDKGGSIRVKVAGKCYISVGNCLYSGESMAVVSDEAGNEIAQFQVKAEGDGAEYTVRYDGEPGWISITFPTGSYTHSVSVWNVVDFVTYDEETGYFQIPAGDVSSFLIALKSASAVEGTKIFLPNGVYDLGETCLTGISGKDVSIIGESMEGTIIVNAPAKENEGIGVTATLKNSSENLYLQDLTIRNAMTFNGGTGRAVTLQDCGKNTICKNVSLESYQDTYYSNNSNAYFYFEDGEIHGVVDYVCGGGDVFYNRVKFVNEKIKNSTIAAPYGAKKYGYVMMDCTIETLCDQFNFGRSWGSYAGLAWINTTINQPEKLVATRFTVAGMNCAADKFVEYNSMDAEGNVISPESNVIEFTHSTGNKKYETILTAEEAAEYDIKNVFPDWRPEEIAAQVVYEEGKEDENSVYLINGEITKHIELPTDGKAYDVVIRKANARGGFGPAVTVTFGGGTSIQDIDADDILNVTYFNLQGVKVSEDYNGVVVKVMTTKDGKQIMRKINK